MNPHIAAFAILLPFAAAAASPSTPRLVVAISVDQFSADLFAEYRPLFTKGLRRMQSGAVFPSGYQSHAATETCPGHSTILTGAHPARTGIIANEWIDQSIARTDKKVYCAEDPSAVGSSSEHYTVSTQFLRAQTLGDRLKAVSPKSRVVAVAGKDRAALMMGGHSIDEAWFWNGKAFVTLPGENHATPPVVDHVNTEVLARIARQEKTSVPTVCASHAMRLTAGRREIGMALQRQAGDFKAFRAGPAFDHAIADVAIGLVQELHLGRGPQPDVLAIGLSATDYVGHTFGTEGAEMCVQLLNVDAEVGRILEALDATRAPYVVVLTADHGGHDLPERNLMRAASDAARADPALMPSMMGKTLAAEFSIAEPVLLGDAPFGDIYLRRDLPSNLRARVLEAARARYAAHPQVAAVFTAAELERLPAPVVPVDEWSLAQRFRASFDAQRSGDLLVALKPHVTPIADTSGPYLATHGSPWNYDRRVPIIFYRPGVPGFEQPLPVETVDIMPTLAGLMEFEVPSAEIDGRCLDLDPGMTTTCPR